MPIEYNQAEYDKREKEGSFVWLLPLIVLPLMVWGVVKAFDYTYPTNNTPKGVTTGIGGGPGDLSTIGVGDTSSITTTAP